MAHRRFAKKERPPETQKRASLLVYGVHAAQALIRVNPQRIISAFVQHNCQNARIHELLEALRAVGCSIERTSKEALDNKVEAANHQGIVLQCTPSQLLTEAALDELLIEQATPFLLILDGVQDPHNLGACLRTAEAAGVDAVIIPKDKSVGLTPTVRKVASGAAETVPLISVTNLARTLKTIKDQGIWLYGLSDQATENLFDHQFEGPVGIVLGAEGRGLRRLTESHCDLLLSIPMAGQVSSLNVSVATGVSLFQVVQHRRAQMR